MNYAVILASGKGSRMKNIDIPKQYYEIDGIPIIIYTLNKFINSRLFDAIYIAINECYEEMVNELLCKFVDLECRKKIKIVFGGKERIDSIHNVIEEIKKEKINDDDVIVIHDGVRPFVTNKILVDSINGAREYGATVAVVPVADTMLVSKNFDYVDSIPKRSEIYKGQSPDSFNLKLFVELENKLSDEQKKIITGTSQVCTLNNHPIKMINGDEVNFKITNDFDLMVAKSIVDNEKKFEVL